MRRTLIGRRVRIVRGKLPFAFGLHPTNRVTDQADGVLDLELLLNARTMCIDRFRAEMELFSHLATAFALADQAENFKFPIAERGDG